MKSVFEFFRLLNRPCRDMTGLLSKAMDQKLPFSQRFAYRLHLLYCTACRRYRKQLLGLRTALRRVADDVIDPDAEPSSGPGLSANARDKISRAIRDR